jgi:hypothetical protein
VISSDSKVVKSVQKELIYRHTVAVATEESLTTRILKYYLPQKVYLINEKERCI